MPIKLKYSNREQVPAELAQFYAERDGSFVLDIDGAVEKSRLDEFRTHNSTLQRQLAELTQKFDGIDPDQARALLKKERELADQNLVRQGDVDKLIGARIAAFQTDLQKERNRADKLQAKLEDQLLTRTVVEIGTRRGLKPSAIPDLQTRAKQVFKMVGDQPVAFEEDGQTQRTAGDGLPLTMESWVAGLQGEAPHLFEGNSGGGAGSSAGTTRGLGTVGRNPWQRETLNLTEQCRIARTNPALAAQMKSAAGKGE